MKKFQSLISINDFNLLQPNSIQTIQSLKSTHFIALDEEISQAAQDESYLYLSTEPDHNTRVLSLSLSNN